MGKGETSRNVGSSREGSLDTPSHFPLRFKLWLLYFQELGRLQGDANTLEASCFPRLLLLFRLGLRLS